MSSSAAVAVLLVAAGADWPRFLGPDASAVAPEANTPTEWSADSHVVWRTELPGPGASSPITLNDWIFVTCYSGYGVDPDKPGDQEDLLHHVVCLGRESGEIVWERRSKPRLPEHPYEGFLALHGYASSTPVTDGRSVYAFFGRSGVWAYSIDGKPRWSIGVGEKTHSWGSATSPIVHRDMVIVNASVESNRVVALDKQSGELVWAVDGIEQSWSTPLIVTLADGKSELVVSMHGKILGLDPNTGEQLWHCQGVDDYVCPSVISVGDVAYVTGGRGADGVVIGVRCGGRGDVTESHRLWETRQTPLVPTPVIHDGLMYWVGSRGIAHCVDTANGELVYRERLGLGTVYGSTIFAGGKLYALSREKGAAVFQAGRDFALLAENNLGALAENDQQDPYVFNATPVVSGDRLLVRGGRFLYCLGE